MSYPLADAATLMDIKPGPKAVLVALAFHADHDGTNARPGLTRLMARSSLSERAVRDNLRLLEAMSLITTVAHGRGGRGTTTEYKLDAARIHQAADERTLELRNPAATAGFGITKPGRWPRETRQMTARNPAATAPHSVKTLSDSRENPSPVRNDPASCPHLAVDTEGWCAACSTQIREQAS